MVTHQHLRWESQYQVLYTSSTHPYIKLHHINTLLFYCDHMTNLATHNYKLFLKIIIIIILKKDRERWNELFIWTCIWRKHEWYSPCNNVLKKKRDRNDGTYIVFCQFWIAISWVLYIMYLCIYGYKYIHHWLINLSVY